MNLEQFAGQSFEEYEVRDTLAWYTKRLEKSLKIFHDPVRYKNRREKLLDYTNGMKFWPLEKLFERHGKDGENISFQFKDAHRGYLLETGGMALLRSQDEALLPYVRYCYVITANVKYEDQNLTAIMHHGPQWKHLPFFIDALAQHAEIGEITCACNAAFHQNEELATQVAMAMAKAFEKPVKGIDLLSENRSVHVYVQNKRLLLLMSDRSSTPDGDDRKMLLKQQQVEETLA